MPSNYQTRTGVYRAKRAVDPRKVRPPTSPSAARKPSALPQNVLDAVRSIAIRGSASSTGTGGRSPHVDVTPDDLESVLLALCDHLDVPGQRAMERLIAYAHHGAEDW